MTDAAHTTHTNAPAIASGWQRLHQQLFDTEHPGGQARSINRWLTSLIVLSTVALLLELNPILARDYADLFRWIDWITVAVFSVEYLLRLGCAKVAPITTGTGFLAGDGCSAAMR